MPARIAGFFMPFDGRFRPPISTRRAFAFAFDLAVKRDPLHSLLVPFALHAPWILASALLPSPDRAEHPEHVTQLRYAALLGDLVVQMSVAAMLRFRARSVFDAPRPARPAPATECYAQGVARLPWLFATEVLRNLCLLLSLAFFVFPVVWVGFRLSLAAEAVVLEALHPGAAFRSSFRHTAGRFGPWLRMVVTSVLLALAATVVGSGFILGGEPGAGTVVAAIQLAIAAVIPVIQYAWTFFYLRLIELDSPGIEVGPAYALGRWNQEKPEGSGSGPSS